MTALFRAAWAQASAYSLPAGQFAAGKSTPALTRLAFAVDPGTAFCHFCRTSQERQRCGPAIDDGSR